MTRRLFFATVLLMGTSALTAIAQTAPPTRIRGMIAALDGNTLTVNSRDGQKLEITLTDPLTVATVKKLDLSAIEPNSYVGIATRTGADGKLTALEVLVFPEAMRGRAKDIMAGTGNREHDDERHSERRGNGDLGTRIIRRLQGRKPGHNRPAGGSGRDFRSGRTRGPENGRTRVLCRHKERRRQATSGPNHGGEGWGCAADVVWRGRVRRSHPNSALGWPPASANELIGYRDSKLRQRLLITPHRLGAVVGPLISPPFAFSIAANNCPQRRSARSRISHAWAP